MFWELELEDETAAARAAPVPDGRFVLHRHHDGHGPHLDLRLEQAGACVGWRVDATALEGRPWATRKTPHPAHWLERDGDAVRVDAGTYAWLEREGDGGRLLLTGAKGERVLTVRPAGGLPASAVRAVCDAVRACGGEAADAARLVHDGMTARHRARARLMGLGRELDGDAFDESAWDTLLAGAPLDTLHAHLRAYEARFDAKYPPLPVSHPEPLDADGTHDAGRGTEAAEIARA